MLNSDYLFQIFKYLDNDKTSLANALITCCSWKREAARALYHDPWRFCHGGHARLVRTLIVCLPHLENTTLVDDIPEAMEQYLSFTQAMNMRSLRLSCDQFMGNLSH